MSLDWLPPLLLLEDAHGNWDVYLGRLHARFVADFIDAKPAWPGKRVGVKRHPEYDGKSATFWHLISDGDVEADRIPNMRRCERIGWPRPMMDEFNEAQPGTSQCRVIWWKETRRNEERYLLAPDDFSYVVVIADRGDYVLPWTAFAVERTHEREKRKRAFKQFWDARKG
jgi:hypothetical protein